MKWQDLLSALGGRALFDASMLLAGPEAPSEVRRQLSRWVASGRLTQLRRGLYVLAPPFLQTKLNALAVASRIRKPSYVSLQSALSYHGAIPEAVPAVTCVTTGRPGRYQTVLGEFLYRHLSTSLFWGYRELEAGEGESACVALPEKALLDLVYLTTGGDRASFIRELRLAPDAIDLKRLQQFAKRSSRPKLIRAATLTVRLLGKQKKGETTL